MNNSSEVNKQEKIIEAGERIMKTPQEIKQELLNMTNNLSVNDVVFVCIGTDRSTGDSLGPLVGTYLKRMGYKNVFGTLSNPVHAMNLSEKMKEVESLNLKVIAIDACLGKVSSLERIDIKNEPLKPGSGVGKDLAKVGDFSISGIVNIGGFMEYFVLQNTRLHLVVRMAEAISQGIELAFPLKKETPIKESSKSRLQKVVQFVLNLKERKRSESA